MPDRQLTPPPEEQLTTIEYTKKARHGHGQDMTDAYNIRQVAGCLPIDPITKRFLLISSSKNPEFWVIVSIIFYFFKGILFANYYFF
jgi:diphosphoinositol-polyphosphate diphosphatase